MRSRLVLVAGGYASHTSSASWMDIGQRSTCFAATTSSTTRASGVGPAATTTSTGGDQHDGPTTSTASASGSTWWIYTYMRW